MLAASLLPEDVEHTDDVVYKAMKKLRYPVYASVKLDGVRAIMRDSLVSRTLKLMPNNKIRLTALKYFPPNADGELWAEGLTYNEIQGIVMSDEHIDTCKLTFMVFDLVSDSQYYTRINSIKEAHSYRDRVGWSYLPYTLINNAVSLLCYEKNVIEHLGEGICFRTPDSPYKFGRSTLKEQYLVKLARFVRNEVTIIGFEEQLHNGNSEQRNDVGLIKRSSRQDKITGKDTLGSLLVCDNDGLEFKVGTGLTNSQRQYIWDEQDKFLGKQITIKHKPHGAKIKPRSPVFVGFRELGF